MHEERALGVVTGEVGVGKTVAVRAAASTLDSSRYTTIYLGCPALGARGLYATIVTALGGTPKFHRCGLIPQTQDALAAEEDERGRRVIVVIDEAHLLDQLGAALGDAPVHPCTLSLTPPNAGVWC